MSSNHTFFTKLVLLLALVGALALAGCGGDDGLSAEDQARIDTAEQKAADEETARMAAEQKAADEETARMAAEQKAADEETARLAAEQKAADEEAARMKAAAAKAAADKKAADEKAAADLKAAADKKAADDKAAADKKAADEKAAADLKAAQDKAAADLKAAQDKAAADLKAAADKAAADLMAVQTAATTAAEAAKMASEAAAMDAKTAMDATMNIATLQTGEMSKDMAMAAEMAADDAMKAYMAAKKASDEAAAATTVTAATTAKDMAVAAQMNAEKYAMTADEKSMDAVKYAKMELMIDGTMKMVGGSSVDARSGELTDTLDDGSKMITGMVAEVKRENAGMVMGVPHSDPGDPLVRYKQAVEARDITIGKDLDTTDDMARLRLIDSRVGSKKVRVYVVNDAATALVVRTDSDGKSMTAGTDGTLGTDDDVQATLKSAGMYYEAADVNTETDGTYATPPTDDAAGAEGADFLDGLDHTDLVGKDTKGMEIFTYVDGATTRYLVETTRTVMDGNTDVTYQDVDTMAPAEPDGPDNNPDLDIVGVTADIPMAVKYSHIHFGVWASLGAADKMGMHGPDALGIGFVQNYSNSGVTQKQGIGTATFNGDWVAVVRRQHSQGTGAFELDDGTATLTANFGTDKFTGELMGLATLEGSLSGNGFSGMKVTAIEHGDLEDKPSAFMGEFEGNIYGPNGEEAAGVFNFSSELSGAFRGAMGGARDGN